MGTVSDSPLWMSAHPNKRQNHTSHHVTYLRNGRGCLTLGPLSECHKGTRNARGGWGRRNMGELAAGGHGKGAIRHPRER